MLSRTFALRGGYEVDQNQELIALGAANVAAGLFQGFSISSSSSRTPVAESAGAKTQLTGVVGALCIALLLVFAPTLLQNLPNAALGAVVIAACISLVDVKSVVRLYHLRRGEFWLSIVCFLGVALVGVIQGIFIAVALALLGFIWRAWRPYDAVLGRVDGLKGYHDVTRYPEARRVPGLVLFRWDAPLFFANAEVFREHVLQAIADAPTPTKWVVVAAEPVTDIDITAAEALSALDDDLEKAGIELCFAEMKDPVKDRSSATTCSPSSALINSSRRSDRRSTATWRRTRWSGRIGMRQLRLRLPVRPMGMPRSSTGAIGVSNFAMVVLCGGIM